MKSGRKGRDGLGLRTSDVADLSVSLKEMCNEG